MSLTLTVAKAEAVGDASLTMMLQAPKNASERPRLLTKHALTPTDASKRPNSEK